MDIVLYYMKLEDKYWGLFLAAMFFLFFLGLEKPEEERKKFQFAVFYGLLTYLLFLCPLTYKVLVKIAPELSGYYELSHIELAVPIIALSATFAAKEAWRQGRDKFGIFMAGFFVLLLLAGDFVYLPTYQPEVRASGLKEEARVFDKILEHGMQRGDESLRLWASDALMAQSRLYDDAFCPLYGKDMGEHPEKYSQSLQNLYSAYNSYDSENSTVINIKDQLDALGSFPYLYPETECEYLVIYNPDVQFEGRKVNPEYVEYVANMTYDPREEVPRLGYEFIGETESYLLFYRGGNPEE